LTVSEKGRGQLQGQQQRRRRGKNPFRGEGECSHSQGAENTKELLVKIPQENEGRELEGMIV